MPFNIDWLLVDELAIGPAPRKEKHLDLLDQNGVKAILSLCSIKEVPELQEIRTRFDFQRIVLPDHRSGRDLQTQELWSALQLLQKLRKSGPVFVHCFASVERSPMVCMAWLVKEHGLSPQRALEYMMQCHKGTSPLPRQLAILNDLLIYKSK